MSIPYIEATDHGAYNFGDDDVFWIVTRDSDGETTRALFLYLEDAKEYLHKVKGIPLEKIKIVTEGGEST